MATNPAAQGKRLATHLSSITDTLIIDSNYYIHIHIHIHIVFTLQGARINPSWKPRYRKRWGKKGEEEDKGVEDEEKKKAEASVPTPGLMIMHPIGKVVYNVERAA